MKKHHFAELIYSVEDTLGLWHRTRKTEQISKHSYDSHREHFQSDSPATFNSNEPHSRLENIFNVLHVGCNLPDEMMSNHVDILESVYNALARQTNILKESTEDIKAAYIKNALIPLICTDIFIFKSNASPSSIYFHLNRLLMIENIATNDKGSIKFRKATAKKYIWDCIDEHFLKNKDILEETRYKNAELLIPELLHYLEERHKNTNQKCVKLHEKLKDCNDRISSMNLDGAFFSIAPISAAYTATIILQDIENKTGMFGRFYQTYKQLIQRDKTLEELEKSMRYALNFNNEKLHIAEVVFNTKRGYETPLHIYDCKIFFIEKIINIIVSSFKTPTIYKFDNDAKLPQIEKQLDYLSNIVSLPPSFEYSIIDSNDSAYFKYKTVKYMKNTVTFDKSNVAGIITLAKHNANRYQKYFLQYIPLINALDCIRNENPSMALDIIDSIHEESLSRFGFVKHSLAVLKIGLMYNLKPSSIKHESLTEQVIEIINHQGIVSIPVFASPSLLENNNAGWLSEPEYEEHSIVYGGNTYNSIVAQAIYAYNFTVARCTPSRNPPTNEAIKNLSTLTHPNYNYSSSLIVRNLLKKLNDVSGKILAGLDKVSIDVDPKDPMGLAKFANELVKENVITRAELNDNLIRGITGSSLGVCLLDYSTIILLLFVPGDDVDNIIALGKKTNVVELLFRYKHPLPKEDENNSLNTKNASAIS
ncbi:MULTISPECIES: hypothetical protein [Aeromonas]|uniref:hypothetical protein n=1 Tax=Aeromonas TaxID=642 RepID=UPI001C242FCA|nr:hypothetical protein [Aeromonas sp. FDAARGOS 1407]QXC32273.1 hypothetical protein I6L37_11550 [Aeromonas sp. FDAARGOS 1407]